MQNFFYITSTIVVNDLDLVLQCMQNQDLLQYFFFLQLLCIFNSSQNAVCSAYIDFLYHFLRL